VNPEEKVVSQLKSAGTNLVCSVPCDRVKNLLSLIELGFFHIPLTREEEGVGISAGAALAGRRPAMVVQTSGIGNMINALASLTGFYKLPLFLMISWRGVYKEGIAAQNPMGRYTKGLLDVLGVETVEINYPGDIGLVEEAASSAYEGNHVVGVLFNPRVWGDSQFKQVKGNQEKEKKLKRRVFGAEETSRVHTRFDFLLGLKDELRGRVVVCNLGFPSKELYFVLDQPSNFYMLGSMGLATSIGLGVALNTDKEVL
jgi:sulfopyruvate decarboxylase subunit beta